MLLRDLGQSSLNRFHIINKELNSRYGVFISESASDDELGAMASSLKEDVASYRRNHIHPQSPIVAKALLMLEGVETLIENRFQERPHRVYQKVLGSMYECATKMMEIGDSLNDAVASCMREYRSSKYRFPDVEVEFDLKNRLKEYEKNLTEVTSGCISSGAIAEGENDVELWFCDDCAIGMSNDDFTGIDDEDRYNEVLNCVNTMRQQNVAYGDEHNELSMKPCDCCGTSLAGGRYKFWKLN